ncbi:hypothetical protein [Argonema antarcticum]|uniref:hypothetical protein n=1 Tax=Argonema antarcticum TaxID=2942763 RepID=UPI00201117AE|nr:hypothetical protein [Argonema antarcticum]MCL1469706.1 hypothetical protein [Argonema antarcticum A004/B2]
MDSDSTPDYEVLLRALEARYRAELSLKDELITFYRQQCVDQMLIIKQLATRPVNIEVIATAASKSMSDSIDQSSNIKVSGNVTESTLNISEITNTVTNSLNQLPDSPEPDQPGIKELLTQLQAAIETDTNLSDEDKAEALEQVKALAEAGQKPQEGAMQKMAKTAIKILKGTIAGLPTAATLVEAANKLFPLISKALGLG